MRFHSKVWFDRHTGMWRVAGDPNYYDRRRDAERARPTDWSGSPDPTDPDHYWYDDETGERVNASTGERVTVQ